MNIKHQKWILNVLKAITFTLCVVLFVTMSWGIFVQYKSKGEIKLEYNELVDSYQVPLLVICPLDPILNITDEFFTIQGYLKYTVNISERIFAYWKMSEDLDLTTDSIWEVTDIYTVYDGRCKVYRYKPRVRV